MKVDLESVQSAIDEALDAAADRHGLVEEARQALRDALRRALKKLAGGDGVEADADDDADGVEVSDKDRFAAAMSRVAGGAEGRTQKAVPKYHGEQGQTCQAIPACCLRGRLSD